MAAVQPTNAASATIVAAALDPKHEIELEDAIRPIDDKILKLYQSIQRQSLQRTICTQMKAKIMPDLITLIDTEIKFLSDKEKFSTKEFTVWAATLFEIWEKNKNDWSKDLYTLIDKIANLSPLKIGKEQDYTDSFTSYCSPQLAAILIPHIKNPKHQYKALESWCAVQEGVFNSVNCSPCVVRLNNIASKTVRGIQLYEGSGISCRVYEINGNSIIPRFNFSCVIGVETKPEDASKEVDSIIAAGKKRKDDAILMVLDEVISHGRKIERPEESSPLIFNVNPSTAQLLIQRGFDVNEKDAKQMSLLHHTIRWYHHGRSKNRPAISHCSPFARLDFAKWLIHNAKARVDLQAYEIFSSVRSIIRGFGPPPTMTFPARTDEDLAKEMEELIIKHMNYEDSAIFASWPLWMAYKVANFVKNPLAFLTSEDEGRRIKPSA